MTSRMAHKEPSSEEYISVREQLLCRRSRWSRGEMLVVEEIDIPGGLEVYSSCQL